MKLRHYIPLTVALVLATGCNQDRIPVDSSAAKQEPPATPPAPEYAEEPAIPPAPSEPSPALPPGAVAQVKGSAFTVPSEPAAAATGDVFTRAHYFEATATVDLPTTATMVETELEGQNAKDAVPVIGLYIKGPEGSSFASEGRPIDGKQLLKDKVELGPGSYTIRMTYFKDTVGQVRPRISLHRITFLQ